MLLLFIGIGSISGVIFEDFNVNSILEFGEFNIFGVVVYLD